MTFSKDDRQAIEQALADLDENNPIARAVAEEIAEFTDRIAQQVERTGRFPTQILLKKPATAFDDIVIRLTIETLAEEIGHVIEVHWVP